MALQFKAWIRVEVYDEEAEEHEDLDTETCEYPAFETDSLELMAGHIALDCPVNVEDIHHELVTAVERQFPGKEYKQ